MEKEGLARGLVRILEKGIVVKEICTDASSIIAAFITKEHPDVKHSFDVWHGAKNFGKKVGAVAAEQKNKELRPWLNDVINHFWYCSRTALGDEDTILGTWRGLLHHVTNVHTWALGRCQHDPLPSDSDKWLEAGDNAHSALTRIVLDFRLLRSLHHYVNFRHAGELENFHEHILMYASKRFAYTYPVYKSRNFLAAIDYQYHKDRPVAADRYGQPRLHRVFSKRNSNWTCYEKEEAKKYEYVWALLSDMIGNFETTTTSLRAKQELSPSDPRKIKRTTAKQSPPSTKTLYETKKSQFSDL